MNRFDNFNRVDGTGLGTPSDGGSAWVEVSGSWGIDSSNRARLISGGQSIAVLESSAADATVSATFADIGSDCGLCARVLDDNNYLMLLTYGGTMILYKREGGGFSPISGGAAITRANGDVFSIRLVGSAIEAYQNGVLKLGPIASTFNLTQTRHGLRANGDAAVRFSAFAINRELPPLYKSVQSGNWADGTTWGQGVVPGDGNAATIADGHTVTVADGTTAVAGASGVAGTAAVTIEGTGKLVVGTTTGAVFVARGDILLAQTARSRTPGFYPLTVNPGSVLEFDAHLAASPATTRYVCGPTQSNSFDAVPRLNGTSSRRVTVRSNAGGANGRFSDRGFAFSTGQISASYADFVRIGDAGHAAIALYLSYAGDLFALDHCTFDAACGQVGGPNNVGTGADLALVDNLFGNTANGTCVHISTSGATPTGTRTVALNHFDDAPQFDGPAGFHFTGNRFARRYEMTGLVAWAEFSGNMVAQTGAGGGLGGEVAAYGDVAGNYFSWGYDGLGNNPHILTATALEASKSIDGNIFDVHVADQQGDLVITNAYPASAETIAVTRNIVLPNAIGEGPGELVSALGENANLTLAVDHNTVTSTNAAGTVEQGVAVWGETDAGRIGLYASVRGNIAYTPAGKGPGAIVLRHNTSTVGDAVAAAAADYNAANNPATTAAGSVHAVFGAHGGYLDMNASPTTPAWSGSPGAHDLVADPQFVDPTRNLATWFAAPSGSGGFGGSTTGTYLGDVASASAAIRLDRSQIARLIAWVRAGYRPTNPAYNGSGSGYAGSGLAYPGDPLTTDAAGNPFAGTIGAMAYQVDPDGTGYTLTAPAKAEGPPGAASDAFTVSLRYGHDPAGTATLTPISAGVAGVFSPTTLALTAGTRTGTFRFTPNAGTSGTVTISLTNDAGLVDADPVTFSVGYHPIAQRAAWLAEMDSFTANFPYGTYGYWDNQTHHYDPARSFQEAADYTGERTKWLARAAMALFGYRDHRILPRAGRITGAHLSYNRGMYLDYRDRRNTLSRDAAILMTRYTGFSEDVWPGVEYYDREVAFAQDNWHSIEGLGCTSAATPERVNRLLDSLGEVADIPAGRRGRYYTPKPFITALVCESLIRRYDRTRDARIPAAIKGAIDRLWSEAWYDGASGFAYLSQDLRAVSAFAASYNGTVLASPAPTTTAIKVTVTGSSDSFHWSHITFTSGVLNGFTIFLWDHDPVTGIMRFDVEALPSAPAAGDTFTLSPIAYADASEPFPLIATPLNMMLAPIYAWYYRHTVLSGARDNNYRHRYHRIFDGWLAVSEKEHNENMRIGYQGLIWHDQGDSPWPAETALAVDPIRASGRVNALSDSFIVRMAGSHTSTASPVSITPSDGGEGGTFVPASAILTTDERACCFRYHPASTGTKTISVANDGGLANPAPFAHEVVGTATVATGVALTGPTTGAVGSYLGPYTLSWSPPGSVPPASLDSPAGGVLRVLLDAGQRGLFYDESRQLLEFGAYLSHDRPEHQFYFVPALPGATTITWNAGEGGAGFTTYRTLSLAASAIAAPTGYDIQPLAHATVGAGVGVRLALGPGAAALAAPVTIVPADGAGGVFSPTSATLDTVAGTVAGTPDTSTFTLAGASLGAYTGWSSLTFTSGVLAGTSWPVAGYDAGTGLITIGGGLGLNPAYQAVVTLPAPGDGVRLSPYRDVTYTPASPGGLLRIAATNDRGLVDPPPVPIFGRGGPLSAAVALSGPTTGTVGSPAGPFTVGLGAGAVMAPVPVYLGDDGGGTFSARKLVLDNTCRSAAFTYAASSPGSKTIAAVNIAGLAAPSPLGYSAGGGRPAVRWLPPKPRSRRRW